MSFSIRRALPGDAEDFVSVHLQSWRESYAHVLGDEVFRRREADRSAAVEHRRAALAEQAMEPAIRNWLAHSEDGRLLGFASAGPARDSDADVPLELWSIYILAEAYGKGVGQALLEQAVEKEPAYVWVLEDNARAQAFYRRNGFVADGTSKDLPQVWAGTGMVEIRMVRH
ncbi:MULTISPECIES: GNAT family N-acetyltransferase [unclassified Arthrobacter]|uniref:GNAT family N-acetyltransferase n=1 Tax=unclassified Arthrobacter TaxID=235627 RepID=UPI001D13FC19|nr:MULTISPECIES: GNAT family N-acetyltransferase [unclassified Arthrobacter]MCC3289415.1 GNAT family N-acetyltransferase [Arthrobacter sp. zg-Y1110]MCC3301068.1 GNAT family N-acetyltransferase [Arthrobacter sp. zg-Y895]UWX85140.1 GNAT family N-acetyltransferase [Arthrobacter sp. zg-Y1110]